MRKLTQQHLDALDGLIKRYQTITLEEIEKAYAWMHNYISHGTGTAESDDLFAHLTGTTSTRKCVLCQTANYGDCCRCIHGYDQRDPVLPCTDQDTYMALVHAKTPKAILTAYRNRAKYLIKRKEEYCERAGIPKNTQ